MTAEEFVKEAKLKSRPYHNWHGVVDVTLGYPEEWECAICGRRSMIQSTGIPINPNLPLLKRVHRMPVTPHFYRSGGERFGPICPHCDLEVQELLGKLKVVEGEGD